MILAYNYHVAVPTSFYEDESLNIEATFEHIKFLSTQNIKSVLISGSTGEQHSLKLEEKIELVEQLSNLELPSDFEIIFGVSSIRQKEAEILLDKINQSKVIDAILLGFPPYILPMQKEAIAYASKLITTSNKPVILYNNPLRTGFNLEVSSYLELLEDKRVIGIKEAGDPKAIPEILPHIDRPLMIYAGGEKNLKDKIDRGFNSLSSIAGNLYPQEVSQWFDSLMKKENQQEHQPLIAKMNTLYENNILPYIKNEIAIKENIAFGTCRSPLGN